MSYNNSRSKALDSNESISRRVSAIKDCFEHLSFALRGLFMSRSITYTGLWKSTLKQAHLNYDELPGPIPEEDLEKIVKELDRIRSLFLSYQKNWETHRQNSSSKQVSKKDREYLTHLEEEFIKESAL